MRIIAIVASLYVLIYFDRISKEFFEKSLSGGEYFPLLSEYLGLRLSYNTGAAFSFRIEGIFLQLITISIILYLVFFYTREEYPKDSRLLDAGYTLIFAGALSHAYERISDGHVIDFIAVKYFAILNFADIFISIGAFFIILSYVRYRKYHYAS